MRTPRRLEAAAKKRVKLDGDVKLFGGFSVCTVLGKNKKKNKNRRD